ncbi:MocR-like pyridoxine biosynthesis transcription factor PdxR [Xanthobacter agilis]|uniref:MocR-like pyridoxine biosynthesis transcription factor PdxR n=1 Tax=Xanthobacter agilis TaxID=47492 RepID=UPI0037288965
MPLLPVLSLPALPLPILPLPLDRAGAVTLQEQIYQALKSRIVAGALPAGTRLAATREAARALGVSRNTVILAYERLASEGYVEVRAHAGAFVARLLLDPRPPPTTLPAPLQFEDDPPPAVNGPHLITRDATRPVFDLWYARPDPRLFPAAQWRRLGNAALGACAVGLSAYGPVGGDPRLRRAIATHIAVHRGIAVQPEQVVVTSGAQDALNLISRLFLTPGDRVVVEDPGYAAAAQVFEAHGARLHPVPVDAEGLDAAGVERLGPRLVYVTPARQFPTGARMSPARRTALLAACAACGSLIVEDDYDGEIVFDRPPPAALATGEGRERTLFVGSFSKTLGSGLRLGYMVVPLRFAAAAEATKSLMSYGQSWLDQQILAAFLEGGYYQRHLNRLRTAYRARRDAALAGLRHIFGDRLAVPATDGGLHLCCVLPDDGPDASSVAAAARAVGVGLHPAAECGVRGADATLARTLLVGFGALTPDELALAFTRIGQSLEARRAGN